MSEAAIEAIAVPQRFRRFTEWLADEFRVCGIVYVLVGIFLGFALALSAMRGDAFLPLVGFYLERILRALTLIAAAAFLVTSIRVLRRRSQTPSSDIAIELFGLCSNAKMARMLSSFAVLALFMAAFLYCKMLIPELRPFDWDATFAAADLALFGGRHPWEWLHPLFAHPGITHALDVAYSSWVPAVFIVWGWISISQSVSEDLRRQYWLSTLLSWTVIGVAMAIFFSSAGPCFLPGIAPEVAGEYSGLNAYLASVNEQFTLSSSLAKEFLWSAHTGLVSEPGGISAMPSMHNAQAVLFAMAGFRISKRLGWTMTAYAAVIFIGSIHLAWHYAVDGIVGAVAAAAIWAFVGRALPVSSPGRRS